MKTRWSMLALLLGALGGCADTQTNPETKPLGTLDGAAAGLTAIQSCGELEAYVKEIALAEQDKALEGNGYYGYGMPTPMAGSMQDANTAAPPSASGGEPKDTGAEATGPSHSDTNTQVAGVDEADFVKTDGSYLYVLNGRLLRILKSFPAAETQIVGKLELPYGAFELYLNGDTLLVYSRTYGNASYGGIALVGGATNNAAESDPAPSAGPAEAPSSGSGSSDSAGMAMPSEPPPSGVATLRGSVTQLFVVDVSDRTSPKIARTLSVESDYLSSRMIGTRIYTVLRGRFFTPYPGYVSYGYGYDVGVATPSSSSSGSAGAAPSPAPAPDGQSDSAEAPPEGAPANPGYWEPPPQPTEEEIAKQKAEIKAQFKAALDAQTLADWAPRMTDEQGGATATLDLTACNGFYKPSVQFGLDTLTIVSLDLSKPGAAVSATTTLGTASQVYASKGALYAVSYPYDYWYWNTLTDKDPGEKSWIHKFTLGETGTAYAGSGQVSGQVLSQFSMDEHEGNLRVATTTNDWTTGAPSSSGVYVLAEQDGALATIGSVGGLAPGERLYSVRFMGDRGYLVTFKQVDPLFTLDLSNPKAPAVAGELKIPGFSTYIHPLDDTHLLTIGRETFDNGQWVEMQGVNLQIFDVSDIKNPTLAHKALFGPAGVESDALYDAKAFSWFPEKGLLALPYSSYGGMTTGVAVPETTDGGGSSSGGSSGSSGSDGGEAPPSEPVDPGTDTDGGADGVAVDPWQPQAGVKVFQVSAATGISELGTIDHSDLAVGDSMYWRGLQVRRTVLIEDALYTIGTGGVKVNAAKDLAPLATVMFPAEDACVEFGYCVGTGAEPAPGGGGGTDAPPAP